MFKSRFAREIQHYSSLSEEYFRDPQLYEDSGPISEDWVDAEAFKKILDASDVWSSKTKEEKVYSRFARQSSRSPPPGGLGRSCSPPARQTGVPAFRAASPTSYRASLPAHVTSVSSPGRPSLPPRRMSRPSHRSPPPASSESPERPVTPPPVRSASSGRSLSPTSRGNCQRLPPPACPTSTKPCPTQSVNQPGRQRSPSPPVSPLQRASGQRRSFSPPYRTQNLSRSCSSAERMSPPPSRNSTLADEDLDTLIPGGRVSQLSQMFEQAGTSGESGRRRDGSGKGRRSLPANSRMSLPRSASRLSLRSASKSSSSAEAGRSTMSRSSSLASLCLLESRVKVPPPLTAAARGNETLTPELDSEPAAPERTVTRSSPRCSTDCNVRKDSVMDRNYSESEDQYSCLGKQRNVEMYKKTETPSVFPNFEVGTGSTALPREGQDDRHYATGGEAGHRHQDQLDRGQAAAPPQTAGSMKPDFQLYSYMPPQAASTPSQISKVETVVSLGEEWRMDYRSLQRGPGEARSKQRLEAEVTNLKIENKVLVEQLQEARYHSEKYKALEKEVEQLTWQLGKMEDSRKVYEKATNQLVNFLDQVSVQLSSTSLHARDTNAMNTEKHNNINNFKDKFPTKMCDLVTRSQSRLSWGGFQPDLRGDLRGDLHASNGCYRSDRSRPSVGKHNRMLNRSHLNLSSTGTSANSHSSMFRETSECWSGRQFVGDEDWLPRRILEERAKFLRAKSDRNLSNYSGDSGEDGGYVHLGIHPRRHRHDEGEGVSINSKEEGEGMSIQSKDIEGVSLESKDSGRSTDSGSGRSTPKIQNREQLCKRAKHLVKAMKHFLAREKSKINDEKKPTKKELRSENLKPRVLKQENKYMKHPRGLENNCLKHPAEQENKVVIQIRSKQKSVQTEGHKLCLGSPLMSSSTTKLQNRVASGLNKKRHSFSYRETAAAANFLDCKENNMKEDLSIIKVREKATTKKKEGMEENFNIVKNKDDVNVIKITNMGTVSVPVPYPLHEKSNQDWI